jgi:hypothetical protein
MKLDTDNLLRAQIHTLEAQLAKLKNTLISIRDDARSSKVQLRYRIDNVIADVWKEHLPSPYALGPKT